MASTSPFTLDSLLGIPVVIEGTTYRLLTRDAVPLMKLRRLDEAWDRYAALSFKKDDELQDGEQQERDTVLDRMCRMVLRAPVSVHDALDDDQRIALVMAFLNPPTSRPTEHEGTPASQTTGASSPHVSPGSTEAVR